MKIFRKHKGIWTIIVMVSSLAIVLMPFLAIFIR